ncbi:MBL fold metallo-hydrolase [Actinomycetospora sp. NBRC 106375]|uniref:MBL fold metallo-hydrolase n=1 Tax=Actinomycetospora sp. NBRC 106375 TaxID=3032207 RepID=UPI0024A1EE78|nr:rhodanese-like domain-containing protein [Actinomycetospora sp. NBRC 106375]GLZ49614.1 MBL fold metallo-hydrolase [Actinomycetospora sp. NBRC 106375]
MHVDVIATGSLGDRSHVIHDGEVALVVDPQRDLDRVEAVASREGVRVAAVAETHIHNDYVTGGHALAAATRAPYLVHAADPVAFDRRAVVDGEEIRVGTLRVRAVATPGHTVTHLAYVVDDTAVPGEPPAVFTGGSLLFGSVGRTDLVDPARTADMTRDQYRSAHRLADSLPDEAHVYPTHGFGSFCSSGSATGAAASTIGTERATNDALLAVDEDRFVAGLTAHLTAYPRYYAHMAPRNLAGPDAADLSPAAAVDRDGLRKRIADGEWVVDLRERTAFAARHLGGTIGIPLGRQFSTYLGWLIPWGTPVTLVGETADDVAVAQRQLARIGIDRPAGAAVGPLADLGPSGDLRRYPTATFADLAARSAVEADEPVLDVRRDDERARGGIAAAHHAPLQDLAAGLDGLPAGRLWVHCASGFRAGIAASLLDRAGRDVVLVDDDYARAVELGLARG